MYISENAIQDKGQPNDVSIWYNRGPICSYNGLFNFCLGARGTGKTFDYKTWAITSPTPFIWLRRLQEDVDDLIANDGVKFTKDLYQEGLLDPEQEVKVKDRTLFIDDIPKIYFVALSTAARKKSQSYGDVNHIVFDEVFEGVGNKKYLKDEVSLFFEFYETVNRLRIDGRPEVRVFFLSNKTTFTNPYFSYFKIHPFEGRFKTFANGLIVVENYKNDKFVELKKQSKFGQLIAQSKYGSYAIENEVWLDDNAFLAKRPPKAIPIVEIHFQEQYISVWNGKDGLIYVDTSRSTGRKYGIKYECLDGELPLTLGSFPLKQLKELFNVGKLRFDSNISKSIMYTLLQTAGQS